MARKPDIKGDRDNWGEVLNEYLDTKADVASVTALTPGPGEVIVGGADGPVAMPDPRKPIAFPRERIVPPMRDIVERFDAGHLWVKYGSNGSVAIDASDGMLAPEHVIVTAQGGSNGLTTIVREAAYDIDLESNLLQIYVRIENYEALDRFVVVASQDPSVTPWVNFYGKTIRWDNYELNGTGWQVLTVDFTAVTDRITGGTPDLTQVHSLRLDVHPKDPAIPAIVHFGGIATVDPITHRFPSGVASITFDDNRDTQYDIAREVLDQYDFPATAYLIAEFTGAPGRISMGQLQKLSDFHGWEMGYHSYATSVHSATYTGVTAEQLEEDIIKSLEFNRMHNLGPLVSAAYPLGRWDDSVIDVLKKYMTSARTTFSRDFGQFLTIHPGRGPYLLQSAGISGTTAQDWAARAEDRKARGAWQIFHGHNFDLLSDEGVYVSRAKLDAICLGLADAGIPVMTVGDVVRSLSN